VHVRHSRYSKVFGISFLTLLAMATTALSAPITLELIGGSVIKGDLVSWNRQQAIVKAEFGSLTFKREQLSQATLQRLELLSGDPQKLAARVAELEATVESLRKDNAALRQQLQAATAARSVQPAPAPTLPVRTISSTSGVSAQGGLSYTVSSTGKRHNSRWRYYGTGRPAGPNEGIPCKICGG
jgi:cell division protein FtsB